MKEREPDSSQWCSLTGQEVIGTNPKQEVRSEHEETFFGVPGQTTVRVTQRDCRIFIYGDIQNPAEHGARKPLVVEPA